MSVFAAAALGGLMNVIRGGSLTGFAYGKALNVASFAAFSGFIVNEWWQVPLCALAMWVGQQPSLGEIVGSEGILGGPNLKAHAQAVLRGAWWGGAVALATLSVWPLVAGCCFGLCFEIARRTVNPSRAWMAAECLFGAVLWGACAL